MNGLTKKPIACVILQAFNVAVLRNLCFIPTEPRVPGPVTAGYKQWLAASPLPPMSGLSGEEKP